MKRIAAMVPALLLAACGGGEEQQANQQTAAASLTPGQWEVTREVTAFRSTDNAAPQIDAQVGTRTTETICVGPGDRPPGELFSAAGDQCEYGNFYMRGGRINVSQNCRREGIDGEIRMTVDGSFTADTLESNVDVTTFLSGDGDVAYTQQLTGRRTGECTPAAAGEGNEAAQ